MWASHKDAVKEGDKVTSAGVIGIRKDHWSTYEVSSMSLRVGMGPDDYTKLTALLGKPEKSRY